jgi:membrane protease YdiL (CAAX protease family)
MTLPRAPRRDLPALSFVHTFPVTMAWLYLVVLSAPDRPPGGAAGVVFGLAKLVQFGFPVVYVWYFERQQLRPAMPTRRGLALAVGFGLFVSLAMFGLYFGALHGSAAFAETPAKVRRLVQELHCDTPARYVLLTLFFAIGHSLLEEYYWRWFAFGWLRRYVPIGVAVAVSSLGFMAHHVVLLDIYFPGRFWTLALPFSLAVAVGGAMWAWIYQRSGSLLAPWLSHALIDAAIFSIGYVMLWG